MKRKVLIEERLSDQFAEYKVKDEKIKIILKNQQASKLTKYVNSWNELTKKVDELKAQHDELSAQLKTNKDAIEQVRDDSRQAIIDIVDVNEAAMSIVVECAGSTLSLAKETDQVQTSDSYVDYKNAWETLYKLIEGKDGLKDMMDQTIKANTTTEFTITQAKRALRLKQKEGVNKNMGLLKEVSLMVYFEKTLKYLGTLINKLWKTIKVTEHKVSLFVFEVQELTA